MRATNETQVSMTPYDFSRVSRLPEPIFISYGDEWPSASICHPAWFSQIWLKYHRRSLIELKLLYRNFQAKLVSITGCRKLYTNWLMSLSLTNPTTNGKECYKSSTLYCSHLLSALRGRVQYSLIYNPECQREVMPEYWSRIETTYKGKFKSELDQSPLDTQRTLKRAKEIGHWLSVTPSHVGGTILLRQSFAMPWCSDMHVYLLNQLLATVVASLWREPRPSTSTCV